MTTELCYAAWALVLAFAQILMFDIARTGQYGLKWNTGARDEAMPDLSPVAERLRRAQHNLFETLPLFIGFVLIAHVADIHSANTILGAQLYVWGRLAYLPLYAFGVKHLRSLVWIISTYGLAMVAVAVLTA